MWKLLATPTMLRALRQARVNLDGAAGSVVRLDRREDRRQHAHDRRAEPAAEAHNAVAGRPLQAPPSAASCLQLPGTRGGRRAAERAQLVSADAGRALSGSGRHPLGSVPLVRRDQHVKSIGGDRRRCPSLRVCPQSLIPSSARASLPKAAQTFNRLWASRVVALCDVRARVAGHDHEPHQPRPAVRVPGLRGKGHSSTTIAGGPSSRSVCRVAWHAQRRA
jgi:hypothetical protein